MTLAPVSPIDLPRSAERGSLSKLKAALRTYPCCDPTRALLREANADLGLPIENGYIAKSVYSIPQQGMVNLLGDVLPHYRGSYSVFSPIFMGAIETGFPLHQIDAHIDTEAILFEERYPIVPCRTLKETVKSSVVTARERLTAAMRFVCANHRTLRADAHLQGARPSYLIPNFSQYRVLLNNLRALNNAR
jgi:methionyl-tRNA formyltransferase